MRGPLRWIGGTALLLGVHSGCGTLTIPRIAVQGTTITIPVPDGFGSGFGRALNQQLPFGVVADPSTYSPPYNQNPELEDPQRGELLFALRTSMSQFSSLITYLPVRYVTRVHVDEGSPAGVPAPGIAFLGSDPSSGQVLALVDVPQEVPPGSYYVFVERWKRDKNHPQLAFVKETPTINTPPVNWVAWGGRDAFYGIPNPELGMPIRIVASPYVTNRFNDAVEGYDRWFGDYSLKNFTADLPNLVPQPKFKIWVRNPAPPYEIPAAWEVVIAYSRKKIEILGVELGSADRSGAYATVSQPTGPPLTCIVKNGQTKISVIDPERRSAWVEVVYRLSDFGTCGRAVVGDFSLADNTFKGYKDDGSAITDPYVWIDNAYSFR